MKAGGGLNPDEENNPLPKVAAITSLSEVLICNISTLTFANPELEGVQVGEVALKLVVPQTPTSVANITSVESLGLNKAHLIGISGKFPSLETQVVPPLVVNQTEVTP